MNELRAKIDASMRAIASLGAPVVVALSGGADSAAVAVLCAELAGTGLEWRAVHVNHHLQPACHRMESAARAMAAALEASCATVHLDPDVIRSSPHGVEAAARTARYRALAAASRDGETLLTGHTASDRVETALMRLASGTGLGGLAGPREALRIAGAPVARPVRAWWRSETRAFVEARDLLPFHDPMNDDPRWPRVAVRTGPAAALCRIAPPDAMLRSLDRLDADADALGWLAAGVLRDVGTQHGEAWWLHVPLLAALPPSVQRVVVHAAIASLVPRATEAGVDGVIAALRPHGAHDGPGFRAERVEGVLRLERTAARVSSLPPLTFDAAIPGDGALATPLGTVTHAAATGATASYGAAACGARLVVRSTASLRACDAGRAVALDAMLAERGRGARARRDAIWLLADGAPVARLVAPRTSAKGLRVEFERLGTLGGLPTDG